MQSITEHEEVTAARRTLRETEEAFRRSHGSETAPAAQAVLDARAKLVYAAGRHPYPVQS